MSEAYTSIQVKDMFVGQKKSFTKTISNEDVLNFSEVTGDKNPIHIDDDYAKTTSFGKRIAHGMISAGLISAVIGMHMPGPGTVYLGQNLTFKKIVKIGDTLTAEAEVVEIIPKSKFTIAKLKTTVTNQDGEVVTEGEATIIPPQ